VKPDSLAQGRGIFLSNNVEKILEKTQPKTQDPEDGPGFVGGVSKPSCGYIVQQYITQPHLIDDFKYDLRLYVFLYGVQPLRIYMHQMAFARFCTEAYEKPNMENKNNVQMHLTNYAINKDAAGYDEGDGEETGSKRSLGAILKILK
jgi:hypothetical protein